MQSERARPGILMGVNGEKVALQDVEMHATLRDLLCDVRSVQVYRNDEQRPIEAVYTFPLPLDAVLLDVHVTLGARTLAGVVVAKQVAERRYEEAVAEGDGAVMLELAEPGLYTMNVGNLLPGEVARITIKYALLHHWTGDRLRLHFPTTIAPRYGAMPLEPHQVPQHSLTVENRFAFSLTVHGELASAQFASPSHALEQGRSDETLILSLGSQRAVMDRDVVIQVKAPHAPRGVLLTGRDGDGTAAIASFQPFFGGLQQAKPLTLAIVVDCSGSMQGDSIQQARRALQHILTQLQPRDRIGLVAFGNMARTMHPALLACTRDTLSMAQAFCDSLQADMGGTHIELALQQAHQLLRGAEGGDVFLITDGQVGEWAPIVRRATANRHRHFTVGVGSAVTESFVRGLAESTNGAAELVSPQEGMSDRIVRHFERLRSARARRVRVRWPEGAVEVAPQSFGAVFDGDTLVASARFSAGVAAGAVVLEVETEDGRTHEQPLLLSDAVRGAAQEATRGAVVEVEDAHSTVARLAASLRLPALGESEARETAVRYRLASRYTNWLAIAERAAGEKAQGIPELRTVPQTLAAGWGGTGRVRLSRSVDDLASFHAPMPPQSFDRQIMARLSSLPSMSPRETSLPSTSRRESREGGHDEEFTIPAFIKRVGGAFDKFRGRGAGGSGNARPDLEARLLALLNSDPSRVEAASAIELLEELGIGETVEALMRLADSLGVAREAVADVLLSVLCRRFVRSGSTGAGRPMLRRIHARGATSRVVVERAVGLMEEVEGVGR